MTGYCPVVANCHGTVTVPACGWLDVKGLRCSALTAQPSTFSGVYALRPLVP